MNRPPPREAPRAGTADRLVIAGGVVFLLGLLALGLTLALWGRDGSAPGAAAAAALLCPIGFAISFAGLVVQARGRRSR
jgi:hypothetical protein